MEQKTVTLKVSAKSNVKSIAASMTHNFEEGNHEVQLVAIGAGAVSQATKAVGIARSMIASKGRDLITRIGFTDVPDIEKGHITAIVWLNRTE